jgi:integrase
VHGTKREAEDVLTQLLGEVAQGASVAAATGTVAELWTRWIEINKDRLSPTTRRGYRRLMDRLILAAFGKRKVRNLRPAEIDAFYARLLRSGGEGGRPMSPQSIHHVHALLRSLLNQAVKWGWCPANPATRATPPRVRRYEHQLPTPEQLLELLRVAGERDPEFATFVRMAVVTGARRGELCALRWSDFDLTRGTVSISRSIVDGSNEHLIEKGTKTHASRRIAIDDDTRRALVEQQKAHEDRAAFCGTSCRSDAFVFSDSPDGSAPWRPGRVTLAFGRLCQRLHIDGVRLHDLRHFAATRMLVDGVPVPTVAGRLGHANPSTTLGVYAHFITSSDAEAARLLGNLLQPNNVATSAEEPP